MIAQTTAAGLDTMPVALNPAALTERIRAEFIEMPGLTLTTCDPAYVVS
jgi:hypothetical protein